MGVAEGSMAEARFFTLRKCPDCMCDLPHRRRSPGAISTGENEQSATIGTIIRLNFPQEIARPVATLPRLGPQHSICFAGRPAAIAPTAWSWRITESVPTPVDSEIQQTIFQIHKAQANIDPITNKEFQWSALKGKIVGTYYDQPVASTNSLGIGFGLDVDTFFAPHCYEVYAPHSDHLRLLINAFSEDPEPLNIGHLRYTETPSSHVSDRVDVQVDPTDFIGKSYGHRTALFGKTRFGKSNTMKVVADTVLQKDNAGQIIFDPSGEYTYWNGQDNGCLAVRYVRMKTFSLPFALPVQVRKFQDEPR